MIFMIRLLRTGSTVIPLKYTSNAYSISLFGITLAAKRRSEPTDTGSLSGIKLATNLRRMNTHCVGFSHDCERSPEAAPASEVSEKSGCSVKFSLSTTRLPTSRDVRNWISVSKPVLSACPRSPTEASSMGTIRDLSVRTSKEVVAS